MHLGVNTKDVVNLSVKIGVSRVSSFLVTYVNFLKANSHLKFIMAA